MNLTSSRRSFLLGVVAGLCVILSPPDASAEKRALLIGINDYINGPEHWDLRGCVNDVHMTREVLRTRFGFAEANIKTLLDREATARNIVGLFEEWLIKESEPDDIVYIHFSGHGSRISDKDGDEEDGWDELLCPADVISTDESSMIIDDQLRELLQRIQARSVITVLDACHSGTGTRDVSLSRPRFLDLESDVAAAKGATRGLALSDPETVLSSFQAGAAAAGSSDMEPIAGQAHRVTISGCKADQTSADAWIRDDLYAGALTHNLIRNVETAQPGVTYRELMDKVRRDMAAKYYQTPQIEGDIDLPWLGESIVDDGETVTPFAIIESVSGSVVRLNIGVAEGVTVGSVYAVYGADETDFGNTEIGRIEISTVHSLTSEASIVAGSDINAGCRAKLVLHSVGQEKLRVLLEASDVGLRDAAIRKLRDVDFVSVAEAGGYFDVRLRIRHDSGLVRATLVFDSVPRVKLSAPEIAPLLDMIQPHLSNAFVVKRLSSLENPAPDFEVAVWANSSRPDAGSARQLDSVPDERLVQARIGDIIRLNFRANRDCYMTAINVGTSGRVTVLFPNQYQTDGWIQGGKVYQTETRGEMPFKIRAAGPPGRELVKVIATLEPLELKSLTMGSAGALGTRSVESGSAFARQLVRDMAAVYVAETPDSSSSTLISTQGWATDYLIIDTRE